MDHKITVYLAVHKETGKVWRGTKQVYERVGGLRAAMYQCFGGSHCKGMPWTEMYNIIAYELKDGVIQ